MRTLRIVACLLCITALPVRAATCVDPERKLALIDATLGREAEKARVWTGVWGGIWGGLTIGQIALAPVFAPPDQIDQYIGAASTALGLGALLAVPLSVMTDADALKQRRASIADPCVALADAEATFEADAENERLGRGWVAQIVGIGFNLVVGAVIGFGLKHWESAVINTAAGLALTEAQLFTQPNALVPALAAYRRGELTARRPSAFSLAIAPRASPAGAGLALVATF